LQLDYVTAQVLDLGKRVEPEIGTEALRVVGSSLLATNRVAAEEMKKAERKMKRA
jgi:hypothetical protein